MHILSQVTDNFPSWISGRERMTVEKISWSISTKEWDRTGAANSWSPVEHASNWATEPGFSRKSIRRSTPFDTTCIVHVSWSQQNVIRIHHVNISMWWTPQQTPLYIEKHGVFQGLHYSKIPILRPPLELSKSGLKDYFWTVPKVVSNQRYTGWRKWRNE